MCRKERLRSMVLRAKNSSQKAFAIILASFHRMLGAVRRYCGDNIKACTNQQLLTIKRRMSYGVVILNQMGSRLCQMLDYGIERDGRNISTGEALVSCTLMSIPQNAENCYFGTKATKNAPGNRESHR